MNQFSAINGVSGILTACALLLTTTASASILYSNFDGITFTGNGRTISSSFSPSLNFTATDTGYLSSVLVAGDYSEGADSFTFSLYDHSNTLIESWSTSFINVSGTVATLTSVTNALLTSGQNYTLIASPGDASASGDWRDFDAATPTLRINGMDSVPEPSTYALLGGVAALGFVTLRRRKK
jgi:hypothetical protein